MNKWIIPLFSAFAALLASLLVYDSLPADMAVHFSAANEPDNYMRKSFGAFLSPVLIVFVAWTVLFTARFEKDENKRAKAEAAMPTVAAAVSLLLLAIHGAILAFNLGYDISPFTVAAFAVGGVFLIIGNLLPRMPQGSTQWPRLSDASQRKFARFQGRLMVVTGFLLIVTAFLPKAYVPIIVLSLIACFALITIAALVGLSRR
ncbi:DUF1648 domain-containing protein [Paenibacillus sp. PL2-23]|uniref:DUF1648 domain-containing protein n=1 Tax=Paenibacillus sp. PL2-23 TaxID=2100729 RepID=UPI0030F86283